MQLYQHNGFRESPFISLLGHVRIVSRHLVTINSNMGICVPVNTVRRRDPSSYETKLSTSLMTVVEDSQHFLQR